MYIYYVYTLYIHYLIYIYMIDMYNSDIWGYCYPPHFWSTPAGIYSFCTNRRLRLELGQWVA